MSYDDVMVKTIRCVCGYLVPNDVLGRDEMSAHVAECREPFTNDYMRRVA